MYNKNKSLVRSFQCAWKGITHTFIHERNFKIHATAAVLVLALCFLLRVETGYFFMVLYAVFFVLCMELFNTAVEALVDLYCGQKTHPLAKIAKDCAAAGVLLASVQAVAVGVIVAHYILTR